MSILGSIPGKVADTLIQDLVSSTLGPPLKIKSYGVNTGRPWLIPGPADLINTYLHSGTTDTWLDYWLGCHGGTVLNRPDPGGDPSVGAWQRALARCWGQVIDSHKPGFPLEIVHELLRRNLINRGDPGLLVRHFNRMGFKDPVDQDTLAKLYQRMPGPSDIVHFTLRHGFEPSVIWANDEDLEFPDTARYWFDQQGLQYPISIYDPWDKRTYDQTRDGRPISWAELYWWTHWVPISPGQAYTMLQRLRPDRIDEIRKVVPDAKVFTLADVQRWLRINDYPPGIRANLTAIAYAVPGRRDLTRLARNYPDQLAEGIALMQDQGYSPANAQWMAKAIFADERRRKFHLVWKETEAQIKRLWIDGVIDTDTASIQLQKIYLEDPDLLAAFEGNSLPEQARIAGENPAVEHALALWSMERAGALAKEWVTVIKKEFIGGKWNAQQTVGTLQQLGLQPDKVQEYLQLWSLLQQGPHKVLTVGKILSLAEKRIMGWDEAIARLVNLGYSPLDASYLVQEAHQSQDLSDARQRAKLAKDRASQEKARLAQLKALETEARRVKHELCHGITLTDMTKYYVQGIVDDQMFTEELAKCDYDQEAIQLGLKSAQKAKEAKGTAKGTQKAPKPSPGARKPTKADLVKWFKDGVIDSAQLERRLLELKYTQEDVARFLQDVGAK